MSDETDLQPVHEQLRRWRRLDDLARLRMRVTRAIRSAETILYSEQATIDQRLKACTVIQQTARTAMKLHEAHEMEERLDRLEAFAERYQKRHEHTNGTTA